MRIAGLYVDEIDRLRVRRQMLGQRD
jgi:hypothetical protein